MLLKILYFDKSYSCSLNPNIERSDVKTKMITFDDDNITLKLPNNYLT